VKSPHSKKSGWILLTALASLAFYACGTVFFSDDNNGGPSGERRVYVNDKAPCDSLPRALVEQGVKLVLQPGKGYSFTINTTRTGDQLQMYYYKNSVARVFKLLDPAPASLGSRETFTLASDRDSAEFFLAQLLAPDGSKAIPALTHVALITPNQNESDTLNLRLMFIHKLTGLPDNQSKQAFADSFFSQMSSIYKHYGIVIKGSYDIVEPQAEAVRFEFSRDYVSLPGTRLPNHVHLYLVEEITVPANQVNGPAGTVLGFSPREVVNIDFHKESRVILSNVSTIPHLAITAVHEMGHFFGLRHTVSTVHDIGQDKDDSNIEDGFTDTRFCDILPVSKRSAAPLDGPVESPYCLRIAVDECSSSCELTNLMHPVECPGADQIQLSAQQIDFLKTNIGLYQHQ
jgi:hypothetical protein